MQNRRILPVISLSATWLLAIIILIVGCTFFEQPAVGPGEGISSEQPTASSQEGETILARIGFRIDPRSGTVSQIDPVSSQNAGGLSLQTQVINDNFDLVAATCPDCGSVCTIGDREA